MALPPDPDAPIPDDLTPTSPYDEGGPEEEDLWFMPAPLDEDPADMPWAAPRQTGPDLRAGSWAQAQADLSDPLARAALALGALDERVRIGPGGLRQRLICSEVAELCWHLGDRVTVDRLALYLVLRLAAVGEDASVLARAAWAVRRLDRGGDLQADLEDLPGFLGRARRDDSLDIDLSVRPMGSEFDALAQDWRTEVDSGKGLHPLTRAALAWHGWRRRGLSGENAQLEGAVMAARLGGQVLRAGGLGFVPLAMGSGSALTGVGDARDRLAAWLRGIEQAALRGLMEADRLSRWQALAVERTAGMSGRTPKQLVNALMAWPLVSAPMLESETGASRAAVQRNMLRFEDLGLVREVTGQSRFRFWRLEM
ncbi:helix-turn-helix domain-containing protein [Fluviibacterium sp. S390]|uniref:helix-turn-helix domain-containing protein n=1 Tax=Fluviibacterium sp. S390 TaxID=3415139 RepID=UPI003C7DE32E